MQDFDRLWLYRVYIDTMQNLESTYSSKSKITLTQLRALVSIAQHGSYSEAALETMQSQSTLSHAIAELERGLDTKLFLRGRRGASLTSLGQRLLEHAKNAVDSVEALEQEVKLEQSGLTGTIKIMSFRSAATFILPPIISGFMERFPNINFELLEEGDTENPVEEAVRSGRADIGILESPFEHDGLISFELARDEYLLLEPSKRRAAKNWQDLQKPPFILCVGGCTDHVRDHWEQHGISLEPAFRIRDDSVILGMVAQGLGISIMPRLAIEPLPAGIRASPLPTPLERIMSVVVTRRKLRQPAIREFVNAIKATI
jgi:DNA-binding transcriptional LysR family regulator